MAQDRLSDAARPHAVLVVEDDEVTAELERRVLARSGRAVRVARRCADALELLRVEPFEAVLLDYNLPDGDPWSIVNAAQEQVPRVPVIVVTAMGNERVAAEALHRGVAEYLLKSDSFWLQLPDMVERVTREAQAEERVRRGDALLQLIAESATDLVATADMSGVIQEISPACRSMLGREPAELIGRLLLDFVHPQDRAALADVFSAKDHTRVTLRVLRADGNPLWVEISASIVRDKVTQRAREILTVVRDVHDRKRAEDKFRALVEGFPEANVITDGAGQITLINARAERLFGYARAELLGTEFARLFAERGRGTPPVLGATTAPVEVLGRRKDGGEFLAELSVNQLEAEGELMYSSTVLDIGERKSLEDQQMLLRLGERLARFESVPELVQFVTSELGAYFDVTRCVFAEIDVARGLSIKHGEYVKYGPKRDANYPLSAYPPQLRRELELGKIVSIADVASDPYTAAVYAEQYLPLQVRAVAGVPLQREGHWVASVFVADDRVRHWSAREIQMLQALVERTWLRIEHIRIERALRESEAKYRHFIESTREGVWEADANARTRFVNPRMADMLGYRVDEIIGKSVDSFLDEQGRKDIGRMLERRRAGINEAYDFRATRKDGGALWVRIEATPLFQDGEYRGTLAMVADVTERRQAEDDQRAMLELASQLTIANEPADALRAATRALGQHLQLDRCAFVEVDAERDEVCVSDEWHAEGLVAVLGRRPTADVTDSLATLRRGVSVAISDLEQDPRTCHKYPNIYAPIKLRAVVAIPMLKSGQLTSIFLLGSSSAREFTQREIALAQAGAERSWLCVERLRNVAALRNMSKDLEQRVAARTAELTAALKEKEVLLKEIHHRVKNNLQVISSMLNLQAMQISDPTARAIFAESQGRVQSIALVHETLYESDDLSNVEFVDYIRTLVSTVIQAQSHPERPISTVIDAASVRLPVGSAIPCGLIINELVTNSLKHAFRGRKSGVIRVGLRSLAPQRIELMVADDGVGLPPGLDPRRVTSLGLDLVFTFAEQLGAEVSVGREGGTSFRFAFHEQA